MFENVTQKFKTKVKNHITTAHDTVLKLADEIKKVETELKVCQEGSEIYIPISKLAKVHNEIAELDQKMTSLKDDMVAPMIDKRDNSESDFVNAAFQDVFNKFSGKSLLESVFANYWKADNFPCEEIGDYVPNLLQKLRNAIYKKDTETFKSVMENPDMPPNAVKYFLDYRFNSIADLESAKDPDYNPEANVIESESDDDNDDDEENIPVRKYSLLMAAALSESVEIVRFLIHFDGVDLMETFDGKNIVHHLLELRKPTDDISCEVEKLVEEILELQPKLANSTDADGASLFQLVVKAKSAYLSRILVEKYNMDVDAQLEDGSTPLMTAIRVKSKSVFDQLIALKASPAVTGKDNISCLHEACKLNWPDAVEAILPKFPDMLKWEDSEKSTPLSLIIDCDSAVALQAVAKCVHYGSLLVENPNIDELRTSAVQKGAQKVADWFKSFDTGAVAL